MTLPLRTNIKKQLRKQLKKHRNSTNVKLRMKVFDDGYDRRSTNLNGVDYKPVRILLDGSRESDANGGEDGLRIDTLPCIKFDNTQQDENTATFLTKSDMSPKNMKGTEQTIGKEDQYVSVNSNLPITELHDPKNQLSSLIKNARENRDSLKQRNERINQAQQRSKRQYGW